MAARMPSSCWNAGVNTRTRSTSGCDTSSCREVAAYVNPWRATSDAAFSWLRLYTAVSSYSGSSLSEGMCPYSDQWPRPMTPTLILPEPLAAVVMLFKRILQCGAERNSAQRRGNNRDQGGEDKWLWIPIISDIRVRYYDRPDVRRCRREHGLQTPFAWTMRDCGHLTTTQARSRHTTLLDLDLQILTDIVDENTQLGRSVAACRPQYPEGHGLVYEVTQHDLQRTGRESIPHEEGWQQGDALVLKREIAQDFNGVADEGLR